MKTKKHNIKDIILGAIIATIFFNFILPVAAATVYKTVEIAYSNIKINIDGKEITPKDANGNAVEPFILNGTTYLPVRAIGEALGKDVEWDGNSQTVFLKNKPAPVDTTPVIETKTFTGQLVREDSIDTYNFNLPYSSRVTLSFEHAFIDDGVPQWHVQVISKSGTIAEFRPRGNVMNESFALSLYLPTGDYVFRVTKGSVRYSNIEYKLHVKYEKNIGQFEFEPNDTMQTATEIQLNKPITGNILPENDIDYYKFSVTSKKEIDVV